MDLKQIQNRCKNLTLLYVEDDDETRKTLAGFLQKFFNKVVDVENGALGLEEFKTAHYDLVITDIEMPKMNGLDMLAQIKKIKPNVLTAVTTAYNDEKFFIKSINLSINKYLVKPISTDQLLESLDYLSHLILNEKKAKELEKKQLQEKINYESASLLDNITASIPNPIVIYHQKKIKFINDSLCNTLNFGKELNTLQDLEKLFDDKAGCITSIEQYNHNKSQQNKVAITSSTYTKYFNIVLSKFNAQDIEYEMLTFNDITKLEYQTIKLENYNRTFQDYIYYFKKKRTTQKSKQNDEDINQIQPSVQSSSYDDNLNIEEQSILRKSHIIKTTAKEYMEEIDEDTLQQLQELDDINIELSKLLSDIKREFISVSEGYEEFAGKLTVFIRTISILFEFSDLIKALNDLSNILYKLAHLDDKQMQMTSLIFLEAVVDDLKSWVTSIFIEQSSLDIHYLDSSLFSSCLQLEMMLSQQDENEDEDGDIDFF